MHTNITATVEIMPIISAFSLTVNANALECTPDCYTSILELPPQDNFYFHPNCPKKKLKVLPVIMQNVNNCLSRLSLLLLDFFVISRLTDYYYRVSTFVTLSAVYPDAPPSTQRAGNICIAILLPNFVEFFNVQLIFGSCGLVFPISKQPFLYYCFCQFLKEHMQGAHVAKLFLFPSRVDLTRIHPQLHRIAYRLLLDVNLIRRG